MFFWMMMASLMGVVMFSNWHEKTKDPENFVAPVYQAMALSAYQQHVSAEQAFMDAMRNDPTGTNNFLAGFDDGIVPMATVQGADMSGGVANNPLYAYVQGRLPPTYKPQNNTRTYLFCIPVTQVGSARCNDNDVVKYIVTLRPIPQRYDGSDKMAALKSISQATAYSRFVGMLQAAPEPLAETGTTTHQPLGAAYHILSGGVAPVNSVYIPNYITCNFPLRDGDNPPVLGDALENRNYIVALSLVSGLQPGQNLGAGSVWPCNEN